MDDTNGWACLEVSVFPMLLVCLWSYLPGRARSPMMSMVCMALFTTCLLFTNSSVGSQLTIFDLGLLQSLQNTPSLPITWLSQTLNITSTVFWGFKIIIWIKVCWKTKLVTGYNLQTEYQISPWNGIWVIKLLNKWAVASPTWCVCPAACVSRWPSFQPETWSWIWFGSINQWCAAFRIKNKTQLQTRILLQ